MLSIIATIVTAILLLFVVAMWRSARKSGDDSNTRLWRLVTYFFVILMGLSVIWMITSN